MRRCGVRRKERERERERWLLTGYPSQKKIGSYGLVASPLVALAVPMAVPLLDLRRTGSRGCGNGSDKNGDAEALHVISY